MMPGTMDFGLFFLMQRDDAWSERAVYDSVLEQMLAAESLGYHSVWLAEHHFSDYGLCPAPPVLASFVAARTATLPGLDTALALRSMRLFADEVAPAITPVAHGASPRQRRADVSAMMTSGNGASGQRRE